MIRQFQCFEQQRRGIAVESHGLEQLRQKTDAIDEVEHRGRKLVIL